jgi:2-polyprenyl-3-methyl-5-hydroxy-6-metoxy-1,4-benzoquinol methylase
MNEERLMALLGTVLGDLGGAYSVPLVRMGESLGIYKALHAGGPQHAHDLAARIGVDPRYLREWLSNQAGCGYIEYDPDLDTFSMTEEQALAFADPESPVYIIGAFDNAVSGVVNQPLVEAAFKSGDGVAWGDQASCMFCAVAKFFRPGYRANLVENWLPALDGVVEVLNAGGRVADVGCGHGHSTMIMAEAYPNSEFVGYDFHAPSIEQARDHAATHGLNNVRFEVATAKDYPDTDFDLVTCFDCLHDLGDPVGAAAHIRSTLKQGGKWMVVEPIAGDSLSDNLNPVGRLYYAASTMICVPTSKAQEVGLALGAQAGEAKLVEVMKSGGFAKVRRAAETPFNMVLEAA